MNYKKLSMWLLGLGLTGLMIFPGCECMEKKCVPASADIEVCHLEGGSFDYDRCECYY